MPFSLIFGKPDIFKIEYGYNSLKNKQFANLKIRLF